MAMDVESKPSPPHGHRALATASALILAVATMLCVLRALSLGFPAPGLDESWIAVLGEAALRPARWGVDLAFTYGPASALVTRFYTDAYLAAALPVLCGVALVNGAALVLLAQTATAGRRFAAPLLLVAVALQVAGLAAELSQDQDAFYFALAFTLVLLDLLRRPGNRASLAVLAAGAALMGVLALSKTSYGVAALVLFAIADGRAAVARARPPLPTPIFLAAALATFLAYGQRLGDLTAYVALQGEVAAGYGEAMYLVAHSREMAGFLLGAAALLAAVAWGMPARTGRSGRASAVLAAAFILAIGFKAGFVRADSHTQIAWSLLGLSGLAVATGLALPRPVAAAVGAASLAVLWVVAPLFLLVDTDRSATAGQLSTVYRDMEAGFAGEAGAWARFLGSPAGFAADARAAKAAAWANLRAGQPLPALAGAVDILPSDQGAVLASGLDYRARPSFQDYSTYTAGLIAANLAFYAGPDAPAWVLFDTGALDDRYPTTGEGALWPELLRRYEPVRRIGERLALHRRAVPLAPVLGAPVSVEAPLGTTVRVPVKGPVFVRIAVTETPLGRLAAALFRPPALSLRVTLAGGEERTYRFIPAIAAGGFLLSPIVGASEGFADLGIGAGDVAGAEVESLTVGGPRWAAPFYDAAMTVEFRPVTVTPASPSPEARALFDELSAALPWRRLVHALGRDKDLSGDRLLAPAPTALAIPVAGLRRIRVGFGIVDGAWTQGHTQGVCFAVKSSPEAATPLWRRCLDPLEVATDRGPQSTGIDLPPGLAAVTVETSCPQSCDWGWSYWSGIAPER